MPQYIVKAYLNCTRCPLCKIRKNIVFGRGVLPAKVMFVGEAPGKSEDVLAQAFVGPSGRLLNKAMETAAFMASTSIPTFFITNIVACRPADNSGGENRKPTGEEAWTCWRRLEQTYKDVSPQKVVLLGAVAEQYGIDAWPDATILPHPAFILRQGGTSSPAFRAFARGLSEVFMEVMRIV